MPFFLILPDPVNATQLFSFLTDPDPDPNCEHLYHEKRIIFGKVSRKRNTFFSVILFNSSGSSMH